MLNFLTFCAGVVYPAVQTYRAAGARGSPEDRHQWLSFWALYTALTYVAFPVADLLLSWLGSLYSIAKFGLVLWLVLPTTRGASVIMSQLEGRQLHLTVANPEIDAVLKKTASSLSTLRQRGEEELRGLAQRANAWVAAQNNAAGGAGSSSGAAPAGGDHHHPVGAPASEDGAHPL